jgi:hypothetical protein
MTKINNSPASEADEDRRKFLGTCGKFAVVTPPAMTLLLSTSLHSSAIASSSGGAGWGGHKTEGWGGHKTDGRHHHG